MTWKASQDLEPHLQTWCKVRGEKPDSLSLSPPAFPAPKPASSTSPFSHPLGS